MHLKASPDGVADAGIEARTTMLCYRHAEGHQPLSTLQSSRLSRRSFASPTPSTVGLPMVGGRL